MSCSLQLALQVAARVACERLVRNHQHPVGHVRVEQRQDVVQVGKRLGVVGKAGADT